MIGILGKKIGMTQIFSDEGVSIPVTVIEAGPCTVLNVSEKKVRLGFGEKKEKNIPKPQLGFYKKINQKPSVFVREISFDAKDKVIVGQQLTADIFKEKDFVDIAGTSIGRGFQGVVKRHHFKGGPGGHGSMFHRAPGGIGSQAGGKGCRKNVQKGKRFPGHMGNERITIQSLQVIKVLKEKNILLIKGAVPGCRNGYLEIKSAKKK
ncbi:MAG: 50S ribosomal protein L3 [Omnitrophica bacterium GWA2_41_15]|nr:MAG: 50S ribosomal protein L3 [Omnitrophica bacterium GWA2_41_15]HAZ10920.1 50S ribosomal protein L3 [Candidatus Omnitrophota bacterium]